VSNSKGQVTVFIILGLIAIIAVSLVLYLNTVKIEKPSEQEVQAVAEVPELLLPVKSYISECVRSTAKDAIRRMGDYGGYTDVGTIKDFKVNRVDPTSSDGVAFSLRSDLIVPYWWYMSSDNEAFPAEFSSKRPNLYKAQGEPSMERQLDLWIEENIEICLADFNALKVQGYFFEDIGEFRVDTKITPETILFYVEYKI